jgi:hypothetical protein
MSKGAKKGKDGNYGLTRPLPTTAILDLSVSLYLLVTICLIHSSLSASAAYRSSTLSLFFFPLSPISIFD